MPVCGSLMGRGGKNKSQNTRETSGKRRQSNSLRNEQGLREREKDRSGGKFTNEKAEEEKVSVLCQLGHWPVVFRP